MAGGVALLCGVVAMPAEAMTLPPGWQVFERPGVSRVTLPAGATQLQFNVLGGMGGGTRGGGAAAVNGTVPVNGARFLYARVGANGGYAITGTPGAGTLLPGAGGGASYLALCAEERCAVLSSLVALAAGGGGSSSGDADFAVAAGGDPGQPGAAGSPGLPADPVAGGGGAGTDSAGGAAGSGGALPLDCSGQRGTPGGVGSALAGGDGGGLDATPILLTRIGGGGGDGRYGGGGGGAAALCDDGQVSGAGGGGGGSSVVPAGATLTISSRPAPDVVPLVAPGVRFFVELERVAPTIAIERPLEGGSYEQGSEVTAAYACADTGGAGIARCDGTVAAGARLDTATTGAKQFTVTATDAAGNTATRIVSYTVAARAVVARTARVSGLKANASAIGFRLSAAARVTVVVERRTSGKRPRWRAVGTIRASGRAGANRVALGRRARLPGRYRVTVKPAGRGARALRATFTVRRAKKRAVRG